MEPFFVVCLDCHDARPWHHRDDKMGCPNGCDARYSMPWLDGFGPDEVPVPRHPSSQYGDVDAWPENTSPAIHVNNVTEMRALCNGNTV